MDELDAARRMSHGAQLGRVARRHPDRPAFRLGEGSRSFAELDDRTNRLAHALAERGIGHGDRIATLAFNCVEIPETLFAAARLGAICVPINFRLTVDEIEFIVRDCGARAMVVDRVHASAAADLRSRVDTLEICLEIGDHSSGRTASVEPYEEALATASAFYPRVDVAETDPWVIMYTSGTTGQPKGVVLTHLCLSTSTTTMQTALAMSEDDEVWLAALPMFHIAALSGMLWHLTLGGTSVLTTTSTFDAAATIDLLEREGITTCGFVPTQWQAICDVPGVERRSLALRRITWGGSPAPPATLRAMAATFPTVPCYSLFGQTEMSAATCLLRGEDALRKLGSVGKPLPNVEARIVDDQMQDVGAEEVGEIVYRGPTLMQGYWGRPDATDEAFAGGWFHSGDLVMRDEEGFVYVVDRKKDVIISGGENIYCGEVEDVIRTHPGVVEVALVGVPHERWVETPLAVIVANADAPPTAEEIIDWCRGQLASYKKPTRVAFVDELPRNASGKVLKRVLRERLCEGQGATR